MPPPIRRSIEEGIPPETPDSVKAGSEPPPPPPILTQLNKHGYKLETDFDSYVASIYEISTNKIIVSRSLKERERDLTIVDEDIYLENSRLFDMVLSLYGRVHSRKPFTKGQIKKKRTKKKRTKQKKSKKGKTKQKKSKKEKTKRTKKR